MEAILPGREGCSETVVSVAALELLRLLLCQVHECGVCRPQAKDVISAGVRVRLKLRLAAASRA